MANQSVQQSQKQILSCYSTTYAIPVPSMLLVIFLIIIIIILHISPQDFNYMLHKLISCTILKECERLQSQR